VSENQEGSASPMNRYSSTPVKSPNRKLEIHKDGLRVRT
jgi:hypothetical protein